MLSELTGMEIEGQYGLVKALRDLSEMKAEYDDVKDAFASVKMRGYGVVSPKRGNYAGRSGDHQAGRKVWSEDTF